MPDGLGPDNVLLLNKAVVDLQCQHSEMQTDHIRVSPSRPCVVQLKVVGAASHAIRKHRLVVAHCLVLSFSFRFPFFLISFSFRSFFFPFLSGSFSYVLTSYPMQTVKKNSCLLFNITFKLLTPLLTVTIFLKLQLGYIIAFLFLTCFIFHQIGYWPPNQCLVLFW